MTPKLPASQPSDPVQERLPAFLRYHRGGFLGPSETLEWDGTRLWRYRSTLGGRANPLETWERLAPPAPAAWARLRQALDQVDAWRWPRRSDNLLVVDGEEWSLRLRWGRQHYSGSGCNDHPEGFDTIQPHLQRLLDRPALPGYPHAFQVRDTRAGGAWEFNWDGRVFLWDHRPAGGGAPARGHLVGPEAEAWADFVAVCHPGAPVEPASGGGSQAGIEMAVYFPGTLDQPGRRMGSGDGFVDPAAAVEALKALAGKRG